MAHKLSDLHRLTVVTERGTSLSSLTPPSLTSLLIRQYDHDWLDWLEMFDGATLERLEAVSFSSKSEEIGHFLGAFELRAVLAASVQTTLSNFSLYTRCSWNPELSSLLSFTEMKALSASALGVRFPCDNGCSSSFKGGRRHHYRLGAYDCIHFQVALWIAPNAELVVLRRDRALKKSLQLGRC